MMQRLGRVGLGWFPENWEHSVKNLITRRVSKTGMGCERDDLPKDE